MSCNIKNKSKMVWISEYIWYLLYFFVVKMKKYYKKKMHSNKKYWCLIGYKKKRHLKKNILMSEGFTKIKETFEKYIY